LLEGDVSVMKNFKKLNVSSIDFKRGLHRLSCFLNAFYICGIGS
jgi:hypothetical protein